MQIKVSETPTDVAECNKGGKKKREKKKRKKDRETLDIKLQSDRANPHRLIHFTCIENVKNKSPLHASSAIVSVRSSPYLSFGNPPDFEPILFIMLT